MNTEDDFRFDQKSRVLSDGDDQRNIYIMKIE